MITCGRAHRDTQLAERAPKNDALSISLINVRTLSEATRRTDFGCELRLMAALLSIEPFQGSRWRLRRMRQIWILNAVLVLPYQFLWAIRSCLGMVLRSTEMILHPISDPKQGTCQRT